jgi:hypothetical protein
VPIPGSVLIPRLPSPGAASMRCRVRLFKQCPRPKLIYLRSARGRPGFLLKLPCHPGNSAARSHSVVARIAHTVHPRNQQGAPIILADVRFLNSVLGPSKALHEPRHKSFSLLKQKDDIDCHYQACSTAGGCLDDRTIGEFAHDFSAGGQHQKGEHRYRQNQA